MRICCKEYSMEMELLALKKKIEEGKVSEKEKNIIKERIREIEKKLKMEWLWDVNIVKMKQLLK